MKKKMLIIVLSLVIILGIGSTLAYLRNDAGSNSSNTITLADFHIDLINDVANITMNYTYPMSDMEGLKNDKTVFAIKNNGSVVANYKISLVDKNVISTLSNSDVRYRLKRTVEGEETKTFDIKNLDTTGLIDEGSIEPNVTISYELICWVDYDSTVNKAVWSKVLLVEGMQSSNLDKSGANFPELLENMIPVYYEPINETEGVWKKADSKNLNSDYQWFDYDEKMWANAVTVKAVGIHDRDYYLNASVGTPLEMDDVTTMWVWIPRYKYKVFNGNNEIANEQMINIVFEHGKDSTGTVKCFDNIQVIDNSSTGEVCTDEINGNIINNKSTYTHPAFTFGDEELTGLWVAKYEMSTDDATCNETPNTENCNKAGLNIFVKPTSLSLKNENLSNMFANIRRMEIYDNIHGFIQSEDATTQLDENGNLTGEIQNDTNKFDTHLIKNMEWGAVAYLSNSKYGKINSKISTTDNVYGVYGMSDATSEYVMAKQIDNLEIFTTDKAGTWSKDNYPIDKYYDKYSNSSSENAAESQTRGKLGDATKEVTKVFGANGFGWYNGSRVMMSSSKMWLVRGISNDKTNSIGIYGTNASSGESGNYTSRPILTVTREMPWLNKMVSTN